MKSTRRELLRSAALLGGAFLLPGGLAACLSDGRRDDAERSEDPLTSCAAPVIGNNHGHALVVDPADVADRAGRSGPDASRPRCVPARGERRRVPAR